MCKSHILNDDNTIKLNLLWTNNPTNGQVLTFNETTLKQEWQTINTSGGGLQTTNTVNGNCIIHLLNWNSFFLISAIQKSFFINFERPNFKLWDTQYNTFFECA